ncbi:MAG: hypothetical protein IKA06_01710 [Clostridia bacterium]|nr:hypothetical protein [Clostridia bacterium]
MYIQSNKPPDLPFTVPKGYSGNAFAPTPTADPIPHVLPSEPEAPPLSPPDVTESEAVVPPPQEPEAAPAFAPHHETRREGGIFSRLPFLSSLLPPPRKKHGDKEGLPEWAVIGIVLLLLMDSPENDLLPFLLILLLWD